MVLQGNIKIFKITDAKLRYGYIEFTLHDSLWYDLAKENKICCANKFPFNGYRVGDYVGIDLEGVRSVFNSQSQVWSDTRVISKVVYKPPQFYRKNIYNSEEFGDGWVEE